MPKKSVQAALAARQQKFCSSWKVALKTQLTDAASSFLARCRDHTAPLQANPGKAAFTPNALLGRSSPNPPLPVTFVSCLQSGEITRAEKNQIHILQKRRGSSLVWRKPRPHPLHIASTSDIGANALAVLRPRLPWQQHGNEACILMTPRRAVSRS